MEKSKSNENIIDKIISDTFKTLQEVYTCQKESNSDNFPAHPHKSFIVIPKKANNGVANSGPSSRNLQDPEEADDDEGNNGLDRISEQELRFIFIEQFNKTDDVKENKLFYSIETPTERYYYFSGRQPRCISEKEHRDKINSNIKKSAGRAANIDLVIFQKKGKKINRVALIEFKAHDPKEKDYKKDICKLIHENSDCIKYFIQVIDNGSEFGEWGKINEDNLEKCKGNTLVSIKTKIGNPDELRNDKIAVKDDYQINYWCGNLKKGQKVTGIINKNGLEYKECKSLFTEESTK